MLTHWLPSPNRDWRYGRPDRLHESGYCGDEALPTPTDVDNSGSIDNWAAMLTRPQASSLRPRNWYQIRRAWRTDAQAGC
jgi:hypothetical protein